MATVNKVPVNGKLPKSIVWNGRTVKQIWINVPSYDHPYADEEKHLIYKNDEQFKFVKTIEGLGALPENTLVFKGFSETDFTGSYISIAHISEAPTKPRGQMVVLDTTEGEK